MRDTFIAALRPGGDYFGWATIVSSSNASESVTGQSVAVTRDDTVIVTGYFFGIASFPTGTGAITLTSAGNDMFIGALNSGRSTFAWAQKVGSPSGGVIGDTVTVTGMD
jgi:hypothetical protein